MRRIWIRGSRRRLLFGDRITYRVTLVADARSFVVLGLRDRDVAERLVADLSLDVPIERYDVTDAPAGPR